MPIEVSCPHCGKRLRAPAKYLNKQVKCPQCERPFPIKAPPGGGEVDSDERTVLGPSPLKQPAANSPASGPAGGQPAAGGGSQHTLTGAPPQSAPQQQPAAGPGTPAAPSQPQSQSQPAAGKPAGADRWHVQAADGSQYGPVTRAELDRWKEEGRLDHQCQVLQDGWEQWKWADDVYPELAPATPAPSGFPDVAGQPSPPPAVPGSTIPGSTIPGTFAQSGQTVVAPQFTPGGFPQGGQMPAAQPKPPLETLVGSGPGPAQPESPFPQIDAGGPPRPSVQANPYEAPAAGKPGEAVGDQSIRQALLGTSPWCLFLSILGFVVGGLCVLGALLQGLLSLASGSMAVIGLALMATLIYVGIIGGTYLMPSYLMLQYVQAIGRFRDNPGQVQLGQALNAQRRFWKYVGIMVIVMFGLSLLMVVGFMIFGGMIAGMLMGQAARM